MDANHDGIPETALAWHLAGRKTALATVTKTWGSAPRPVGAQLVIDADQAFQGSVSGGCVEGAVIFEAGDAIADGTCKVLSFGVSDDTAFEVGLACGGEIEVLVEPVGVGQGPKIDELEALDTAFLDAETPGWTDILAWFSVWMAQTNIPRAEELLAPFPAIRAWGDRMNAIGHGERTDIDAATAHTAARESEPEPSTGVEDNPFHDFRSNDTVAVVPDDYGFDPVIGRLTALNHHRISIERNADGIGSVAVHFPRSGYRVEAAQG